MKFFKRIVVLSLSAMLLASCGSSAGNPPQAEKTSGAESGSSASSGSKVLTMATQDPQVQLDMQLNTYSMIMCITDNIVESLLVTDNNGDVQPVLLTGMPTLSEDKKTYSFELKEGIKFHNGETLTSNDVKYSLERLVKKVTMATLLEKVEGFQDLFDNKATELTGIKVVDDRHFEITLTDIYTPFVSVLSTPYCGIYPAKAAEEAGDEWGFSVLYGTGPFKLNQYTIGQGAEIDRFDDYHGTTALLDKVVYKFVSDPNTQVMEYQKGTVDLITLDSALYPNYADGELKDQIHSFQPAGGYFMTFNVKTIDNPKVREAISLSIDRNAITEKILFNTAKPATSFLPEGITGHDPNAQVYEYNPEKAKQLLAEAGYPNGYDLRVTVNTKYTISEKIATAIQAQAKAAGVNVTIEKVDSAAWTDMKAVGSVDAGIGSWYVDYNDPDSMIFPYKPMRVDVTSSFWHNPEFEKLLTEGVQTDDTAKRQEIYQRANTILTREDFASAPIYNESMFYMLKPNIKDFSIGFTWRTFFATADIEAK